MASVKATNPFGAEATLKTRGGDVRIYRLDKLSADGIGRIDRLPYSIKVLLECALRHAGGSLVGEDDVAILANWDPKVPREVEFPFLPGRVLLQDFTGVPAVVDLAAMRSAVARLGGDPRRINPGVPCDLVIDHSVQVDLFGSPAALKANVEKEFERNRERYELLRWGQKAFRNFRVVPPATGICHQVNLEYLAKGVATRRCGGEVVAFPDSLVGTDSHTTMINGLGVLGWGVGGIEAEAVMLGEPIHMLMPEVIGFRLYGRLREGVTATDLVLTVTQRLRSKGVVGKFVEFFGEALDTLGVPDRATISNMSPEYGATIGFFPIDSLTLDYLRMTGRTEEEVDLVERYTKEQGLFRAAGAPPPEFTDIVELDASTVTASLAGPKRPQDRVSLPDMKKSFRAALTAPPEKRGFGLDAAAPGRTAAGNSDDHAMRLGHGCVVIAAITSCTNTSNPSVMIAAGLLAKKAVERGLAVKPWVKTSLSPGSRVVTRYLDAAGLTPGLETLGFHNVGYGCMTCIGNSGPLAEPIAQAITNENLVAAAVLSGNRNFEGRINPLVKAAYLASPPLVVAYALAGTVDIDLTTEPIGRDKAGRDVFLKDIWPSAAEVGAALSRHIAPEQFRKEYADIFAGNELWRAIPVAGGDLYPWRPDSTYIQEPPFFVDMTPEAPPIRPIRGARVLVLLGDSITTDHISPAGSIKRDSPAGLYLQSLGIRPVDFNSYGARRGNDRVMTRGTFANIRLRNLLAPGTEGPVTIYLPTGEPMSIYDAAMKYKAENTPLLVLAGKEYGSGSSRDWAAKGTALLGVKAVLAESYERIHRSNLVGMGVLPLQLTEGETRESLGLTGREVFDIPDLTDALRPKQGVTVTATAADGTTKTFPAVARIDTAVEVDYYRNGGILRSVLRRMLRQ